MNLSFDVVDVESSGTGDSGLGSQNEIIQEFTSSSTPPPLFGTLSLRLDDAYPVPPTATFYLALSETNSTDDLTIETVPPAAASEASVSATELRAQTTRCLFASVWLRRVQLRCRRWMRCR